jgi:hypothetical protein
MRIGFWWSKKSVNLYSNASFDTLYTYVGHNTGNLAFVYAISRHIVGQVKYLAWHTPPQKLRESADIIVIPCANQLGAHTDLGTLANNLAEAGLPVVAIGLGAQSKSDVADVTLKEGTLQWLKTLGSLAVNRGTPNIYARGPYTQQQIEKLGVNGSISGGCPSFFINESPNLGAKIKANSKSIPAAICVAGGHQSWGNCAPIEQQLVAMISDPFHPGSYVTQSMADMIKISRDEFATIEPNVLEQIRKHIAPHLETAHFIAWCRAYARSFYDVPSWMDHLRRYDLTVGPRYHGVGLALQAERMGLTVTIDSRTKELCQQTGVPHVAADELKVVTRKALFERLSAFDAKAYDQLRAEKAAAYVKFLEGNGLTAAPGLKRIAGMS